MKLSEAIMLNGMDKPQGYGSVSIASVDAPCALGGALQSIGKQTLDPDQDYSIIETEWPWVNGSFACPECKQPNRGHSVVWHLNDTHRWTRAQIAEWVSTIEPQEVSGEPREQGIEVYR